MSDLIRFEGDEKNPVRRIWVGDKESGEWYFVVVDIIQALLDSKNPSDYWYRLQKRVLKNEQIDLAELCDRFKIPNLKTNRLHELDCANIEIIFRIIQSIPSPKVEPFKRWLAAVGQERLEEVQDPERALERIRVGYRQLGRDEKWIETRIQSIVARNELTDEWGNRQVGKDKFGILTAEISQQTFDINPSEHREIKGLAKKHNLRDHMTPQELAFTILGETATTDFARESNAQGFDENLKAAEKGGKAAGAARRAFEDNTGSKVVSASNMLPPTPKQGTLPFTDEENEK